MLLEEGNENEFESLLVLFPEKLATDPQLQEFKKYFVSTYVPRKELWAVCYRKHLMLNTNMVLEAFHKVLKYIYLKGKQNRRVDDLLFYTFQLICDTNFERLTKLCDGGKITHYLNDVNNRHRTAAAGQPTVNQMHETSWSVQFSTSRVSHIVEKHNRNCHCKVIRVACQVCVHEFSCQCYDYEIKNFMCKHIRVHAAILGMKNTKIVIQYRRTLLQRRKMPH